MPIHMRMRKLRGPHMKKSMPFEPFRTHTQAVNLQDLEARFEAGDAVTLEALKGKGLATRKGIPVKVLAKGEPEQGAHRPRARVQRRGSRADRVRGRDLRARRVHRAAPARRSSSDDLHDPRSVQGRRDPQ